MVGASKKMISTQCIYDDQDNVGGLWSEVEILLNPVAREGRVEQAVALYTTMRSARVRR